VLATLAALAGMPPSYAQAGWLVAGTVLLTASCVIAVRHPASFTILLSLAALAWPVGTILWAAGAGMDGVVLWWMSFLVLTIAAERLELNRMLRPPASARRMFWVPVAVLLVAAIAAVLDDAAAWRIAGVALLGLAAWLGRYDVARRTIRMPGLPRFAASCLLSGYAWLGVAGLTMLALPLTVDRLAYDAALHAVFLGFVIAMVFGHAPIILPAVTGAQVPFRRLLYGPLVLLNLSVAARFAGDMLAMPEIRRWSGVLTAVAIAIFVGSVAALAGRARSRRSSSRVCAGTKTNVRDGASLAP
jgi:hypothetical protein